jgi:hypothetical protein
MKPEKKSDCIDVEILSGGVAVITLNRPPANALAEVGKNATRGGKHKPEVIQVRDTPNRRHILLP